MITKADALLSLCPNAEWIVRGEMIDWKDTVEAKTMIFRVKNILNSLKSR